MFSKAFTNNIAKSVETGERCVYGFRWFDYSFGMSNPKLPIDFYNNTIIRDGNKLYITVDGFHDICRESIGIYTYPHKIIHNKKELRRYIGKRYFNITEEEHELLNQFWKSILAVLFNGVKKGEIKWKQSITTLSKRIM